MGELLRRLLNGTVHCPLGRAAERRMSSAVAQLALSMVLVHARRGAPQVAQLSRRTLLMPDVPCEAAWIHDEHARREEHFKKSVCAVYTFHRDANRCPATALSPPRLCRPSSPHPPLLPPLLLLCAQLSSFLAWPCSAWSSAGCLCR